MARLTVASVLKGLQPLGGFDRDFYLRNNPDIAESGMDPLVHYVLYGWTEGRHPCQHFSTTGYLKANPDVAQQGICPLIHFWNHGLAEGRTGWQI